MTTTITAELPRIDRFSRHDLKFETSGDLNVALGKIDEGGSNEHGVVVVRLNIDRESYDRVLVDDRHDSICQIDAALEALIETRDALKRLKSEGPVAS